MTDLGFKLRFGSLSLPQSLQESSQTIYTYGVDCGDTLPHIFHAAEQSRRLHWNQMQMLYVGVSLSLHPCCWSKAAANFLGYTVF